MWLSRQLSSPAEGNRTALSTGRVTIAGEHAAVMLEGERRELSTACPGGVRWAPASGDDVLVFRSDEGEQYIIGLVGEGDDMPGSGEVLLKSGKCSILLGSGGISISGDVRIDGSLSVSGRLSVGGTDILAAIEALRSSV